MKNINCQRLIKPLKKPFIRWLWPYFMWVCLFFLVFLNCSSIWPEQPRRWGLCTHSQSLDARLITCLALKPIFEKKKGQTEHYYCHKKLGMQMIIASLRSALSETAQKIELCPTSEKTYKFDIWLLYNLHIIVTLAEPQSTWCIQYH